MSTIKPRVFKIEGEKRSWLQHLHIYDECLIIVEFAPAMFGWNVRRVDRQGASDWPGMTRDEIAAWKLAHTWSGGPQIVELGLDATQEAIDALQRYETKQALRATEA